MAEVKKDNTKSILDMAHGAIKERVDYEVPKIIQNILDPNTKAAKKRSLTLTLEFLPDESRSQIQVTVSPKPPKLEPTKSITTNLYVTGDTSTGETKIVEMVPEVPGQTGFDGAEQEPPATLRLIKNA